MATRIFIPTALRPFAGGHDTVEVDAATVAEALDGLVAAHPALGKHLFSGDGRLRAFVNVYRNDEDIRYLEATGTPLGASDTLTIVPSIAGGSPVSTQDPESAAGSPRAIPLPELTREEMRRYSRHLIMPEVAMSGQRRLKAGSVLMIGAGGLGSPLGLYLAAAGVGRIGIVDFDVVDETNLHRQVLHGSSDVGRPKLDSARDRLSDLNPNTRIETFETALTSENALELIRNYDVIVDGTDNFPTRYLVNDACVLLDKPNVYGSIFRFEGQASVFHAAVGPCYRCLYPEPPPPGLVPSCAEGGVLGILPGIIGVIQATETVKLLLGIGESLAGRLLLFDALKMSFRELKLRKDPECPICGPKRTIHELIDYHQFCGVPSPGAKPEPAAETVGVTGDGVITARELKTLIDAGTPFRLIDVREAHEFEINRIPGSELIPLGQLPEQMHRISSSEEVVLHCKAGLRSAQALAILREAGFTRLRHLTGGIDAWATEIDPTLPRY